MAPRGTTPREALADLLAVLLDEGEIRRLVAYTAEGLDRALKGNSRNDLADSAADLLLRRGVADEALFARLSELASGEAPRSGRCARACRATHPSPRSRP